MAGSQKSKTGPFFRKISLFNAACFDIASLRLADSDDEAAVLHSAQDAGINGLGAPAERPAGRRALSKILPQRPYIDLATAGGGRFSKPVLEPVSCDSVSGIF